jgi:hypothetical protein
MSENKEKLEIFVEDEPNEAKEPEVVVDEELETAKTASRESEKTSMEPNEAIERMKRQLEDERRARADAEMRARQAHEQATKAYSEVNDTNTQLVHSAIQQVKTHNGILTSQYAEAMNTNDYERAAQIQSEISHNAAKLVHLENGLQEMKNAPPRMPVEPVPPAPRGDALDQIINAVTPASADWLRSNRDNLQDERSIKKMFRAHDDAIDDGVQPDTAEYFRYIEQRLGISRGAEEENAMSAAAKPMQRSAPPAAAPVNRGTSPRNNVVRLTRAEADMAKVLGMTEKEYATHKLSLQREGKLS